MNLPFKFNDSSADEFHKVHISGVCFTKSLELLNQFLRITLSADYSISYRTLERLVKELTYCTIPVWHVDGQLLVASLIIKYVILHKIGILNWIPSTHVSTISTSLGHFIYLIGTGVRVNVGEFFFNHLLRHVDTFAIHILIHFPRLLSNFLVSQRPSILAPVNVVGSAPKVIYLSMRLFQVLHVSNVPIDFDTPSGVPTVHLLPALL
ncbi:uncharacterized protein E5676_scaffold392G00130 [Cucumis melo var. makuwa]|uniref:Putative plant transposon protein domain-containing protein n=1 Tax=Cucumis melo var. makuwa TaxID=1194695 RepID=A0A5A7VL40_CUCMM|nr:uncharacterized protein E6C27_scaffold238G00960 [Cucumis melo var. makuwa]TYK21054.1 uncharacterized protein E5676_scaffold392G00130 [Cucumis melo var. makuwa]